MGIPNHQFYLKETPDHISYEYLTQINKEKYNSLRRNDFQEYSGIAPLLLIKKLDQPYVFFDNRIHILYSDKDHNTVENFHLHEEAELLNYYFTIKKYVEIGVEVDLDFIEEFMPTPKPYNPEEDIVICSLVNSLWFKIINISYAADWIDSNFPCDFALSPDKKCFAFDTDTFWLLSEELKNRDCHLVQQEKLGEIASNEIKFLHHN